MENETLAYENKGQEKPEGENHGMRWLCLLAFQSFPVEPRRSILRSELPPSGPQPLGSVSPRSERPSRTPSEMQT